MKRPHSNEHDRLRERFIAAASRHQLLMIEQSLVGARHTERACAHTCPPTHAPPRLSSVFSPRFNGRQTGVEALAAVKSCKSALDYSLEICTLASDASLSLTVPRKAVVKRCATKELWLPCKFYFFFFRLPRHYCRYTFKETPRRRKKL